MSEDGSQPGIRPKRLAGVVVAVPKINITNGVGDWLNKMTAGKIEETGPASVKNGRLTRTSADQQSRLEEMRAAFKFQWPEGGDKTRGR